MPWEPRRRQAHSSMDVAARYGCLRLAEYLRIVADGHTIKAAWRDHFAPVARAAGFGGSGSTFRRIDGDLIQIVNLQGSSWGHLFYLNLGIHPLIGCDGDPRKISANQCLLSRRLVEDGARDGWRYTDDPASMIAAAQSAAREFVDRALPLFAEQSGPNAPIFSLTMKHFEQPHEFSGFWPSLSTKTPVMNDLRPID